MNKKSTYHAILAAGYITTLVSFMSLIAERLQVQEDNIFMPISMLAMLVLSVAVMAYLFFYDPVLLLLDGKHPDAIKMFLGTIAVFAVLAVSFFLVAAFVIPFLIAAL